MMTEETKLRGAIVRWGRSLFERGFSVGSAGNISVKLEDGFLCTPTNSCLGFLEADRLTKLDANGDRIDGDAPTKELPLHMAFYEGRSSARAVVHLHATYSTALSCLADVDPEDAIPPITPYVVMRVGRVPVLPYTKPGSADIAPIVRARAERNAGVLLANHGAVVAGASLESAISAIEELEETAKLIFLTKNMPVRHLDATAIADLESSFKLR